LSPSLQNFAQILHQYSQLPQASLSAQATGLLHQALLNTPIQLITLNEKTVICYYIMIQQPNYMKLWEGSIILQGGLIAQIENFLQTEQCIDKAILVALLTSIENLI